jgi:hypothetical protein
MGGCHEVADISCRCSNAGDGISDSSSPCDTLSDSFLRRAWKIGHWITRVRHEALLAGRAYRSPSNLAIRLLPGQRPGSVHSQSNDARSSIWPMALIGILGSGTLRPDWPSYAPGSPLRPLELKNDHAYLKQATSHSEIGSGKNGSPSRSSC